MLIKFLRKLLQSSITDMPPTRWRHIKEPVPSTEPWPLYEDEDGKIYSPSPILDIRDGISKDSLHKHITAFISWSYQLQPEDIHEGDYLIDDIEKLYYSRVDGVSVEEARNKPIFGGLSDRGFTVYPVFSTLLKDLASSMGLDYERLPKEFEDVETDTLDDLINKYDSYIREYGLILKQ